LHLFFRGAPGKIAFIAPSSVGPDGGGLYYFELTRSGQDGGGTQLVVSWSLYQPGEPQAVDAAAHRGERVLLNNVTAFTLRYFGLRNDDSDGPSWADNWDRDDVMPDLVEISSAVAGQGEASRIIVELRLRATE
jgi:hypothetical protein